jgi:hypothetical protein
MNRTRTDHPRRTTTDDLHPISRRSAKHLHERTLFPLESGNTIAA